MSKGVEGEEQSKQRDGVGAFTKVSWVINWTLLRIIPEIELCFWFLGCVALAGKTEPRRVTKCIWVTFWA